MVYSGRYSIKNHSKYRGDVANIVYRSLWEKAVFMWCDNNPKVKSWSSEEVVIPYYYEVDKKYHKYYVDLKIIFEDGKIILVEIKPEHQTHTPKRPDKSKRYVREALEYVKNMNKWEAANEYAMDRGWEFQIWTEKTLQEMKLLPKDVPGKLKSFKPMKPYRRRKRKK